MLDYVANPQDITKHQILEVENSTLEIFSADKLRRARRKHI